MSTDEELALLKIENANLKANVEQWKAVVVAQEEVISQYKQILADLKKGLS